MNHAKLINPFTLGGVASGKQFAGRAPEIARLRSIAAAGQHTYVFAPRRYGKTSLLRAAFESEAEARHLVLIWCDCLPVASAEALAKRLGEDVVRAARSSKVVEWAKEAAALFSRLRPTLSVGADGETKVRLDLATTPAPSLDLEDALAAVGRLAEKKKKPVVVVLDEFQQIAEWDSDHQTEAVVRTVVQNQRGVAYVFAGSQYHMLQEMFTVRASPLFKLAAPFPLGRLSREELLPWLKERFREGGFSIDPVAADAIVMYGGNGHPWATQYLAHFVWDCAVAEGHPQIMLYTVGLALRDALRVGDTIYGSDFAGLTVAQRRVLHAIATEPTTAPTAAEYLKRQNLPAKSTVAQALRSLVEKGHVERLGDRYVIGDPLFGEWIRRPEGEGRVR